MCFSLCLDKLLCTLQNLKLFLPIVSPRQSSVVSHILFVTLSYKYLLLAVILQVVLEYGGCFINCGEWMNGFQSAWLSAWSCHYGTSKRAANHNLRRLWLTISRVLDSSKIRGRFKKEIIISYHLLSAYYLTGTVLSPLSASSNLIFTTIVVILARILSLK